MKKVGKYFYFSIFLFKFASLTIKKILIMNNSILVLVSCLLLVVFIIGCAGLYLTETGKTYEDIIYSKFYRKVIFISFIFMAICVYLN